MWLWLAIGGLHSDEEGCFIAKPPLTEQPSHNTPFKMVDHIRTSVSVICFLGSWNDGTLYPLHDCCPWTFLHYFLEIPKWDFLVPASLVFLFLDWSPHFDGAYTSQLPLKAYVRLHLIPACLKRSLFYPHSHCSLARYRILGWNHFPDNFWSHLPTVF